MSIIIYVMILMGILSIISFRRYKTGVIPGPRPIPLLGNLLQLGKNPHEALQAMYNQYGNVFRIKMGLINTIVLTEPDIIKEAFVENGDLFINRFPKHSRSCCNQDLNMANTNGEHNKKMRLLVGKGITNQKLKQKEEVFRNEIELLLNEFRELARTGVAENPQKLIRTCSLNMILQILFGMRVPYGTMDEETKDLVDTIHLNFQMGGVPIPSDYIPFLQPFTKGKPKAFFDTYFKLRSFVENMCLQRLQEYNIEKEPSDTLEVLLQQFHQKSIPMESVIVTLIDLILTGTDTSANTISYAIIQLSNNPDIQEKVYQELKGFPCGASYLADRTKTPYCNAMISESLRMFAVAPLGVPHMVTKDIEFRGFFIEKGSQIIQNIYATCLSEKVWKEPTKFDPTRFLGPQADENKHKYVFGSGLRNCLGMNFAEMELHLVLSSLLKTIEFQRTSEELLSTRGTFGITLSPQPFSVYYKLRQITP